MKGLLNILSFMVDLVSSGPMDWLSTMNQLGSQGGSAAQRRRTALGVLILLLVDVIWVASSELTSVRTWSPSLFTVAGMN